MSQWLAGAMRAAADGGGKAPHRSVETKLVRMGVNGAGDCRESPRRASNSRIDADYV